LKELRHYKIYLKSGRIISMNASYEGQKHPEGFETSVKWHCYQVEKGPLLHFKSDEMEFLVENLELSENLRTVFGGIDVNDGEVKEIIPGYENEPHLENILFKNRPVPSKIGSTPISGIANGFNSIRDSNDNSGPVPEIQVDHSRPSNSDIANGKMFNFSSEIVEGKPKSKTKKLSRVDEQ